MTTRRFHSCFAIDANVTGSEAVITDSTRCRWHVDLGNAEAQAGFKSWLKGVFLKGVAQTLTVFEYEERGEAPDAENWIIRFCNVSEQNQLNG